MDTKLHTKHVVVVRWLVGWLVVVVVVVVVVVWGCWISPFYPLKRYLNEKSYK